MPTRAEPVRRPARGPQEWQAYEWRQTMDVYHTKKELISLPELEKRWSLDAEELARIYVEDSLTVFFVKKIRKANDSYYFLGIENKYDNVHEAIGDFSFETHIIKTNEGDKKMEIFLLFSEILEYEKKKPYLLGNPIVVDYKTAVDSTVKSDAIPPISEQEMLSLELIREAKHNLERYANRPDTSPLIGRQEEAQDNARVAKLEEENQGLRDEIRGLQDEIERLKQELARKSGAQVQGVDKVAQALALPPYGMIKQLDEAYRKGMTPTEAAKWLKDKQGKNLSWSQLGALLYAGDQMPKYGTQTGQRFYKGDTTEKLPW